MNRLLKSKVVFNTIKSILPFHFSSPVLKEREKPTVKSTQKSILKPTLKSKRQKKPYIPDLAILRVPKIKNQVDIDEILPQLRFLFNEKDTENQDDLIEIPGLDKAVKKWKIFNHNPDLDILMFLHNKENTIK